MTRADFTPSETHPSHRLNVYTCTNLHNLVTVDVAWGVTPMFIRCEKCGQLAASAMYPRMGLYLEDATHEWYAPTSAEAEAQGPGWAEHARRGGLSLRPRTTATPQLHDRFDGASESALVPEFDFSIPPTVLAPAPTFDRVESQMSGYVRPPGEYAVRSRWWMLWLVKLQIIKFCNNRHLGLEFMQHRVSFWTSELTIMVRGPKGSVKAFEFWLEESCLP